MTFAGYIFMGLLALFSLWFVIVCLFVANLLGQKTALTLFRSSLFGAMAFIFVTVLLRGVGVIF